MGHLGEQLFHETASLTFCQGKMIYLYVSVQIYGRRYVDHNCFYAKKENKNWVSLLFLSVVLQFNSVIAVVYRFRVRPVLLRFTCSKNN